MHALADPQDNFRRLLDPYGAVTHEVVNQPVELVDTNLYDSDTALKEAVQREGAGWASDALGAFGARAGSAEFLELGTLANRNPPELDTHDRTGRRVDLVRFHPSYHALMKASIEDGLHSSPWTDPGEGAHVARAARSYMQTEVEAGHGCPITMTFATSPCLKLQGDLAAQWLPKIQARVYDPRNIRAEQKQGVTIGMAMTEKQGRSDVRANTTRHSRQRRAQARHNSPALFFVSAPCATRFSCWPRRRGPRVFCSPLATGRNQEPVADHSKQAQDGECLNASSRDRTARRARLDGRSEGRCGDDYRDGRHDALRLHDRLVRGHAHGGITGDRSLPPAEAFGALIDQPLMTAVPTSRSRLRPLTLTIRIARARSSRRQPADAGAQAPRLENTDLQRTPGHAYGSNVSVAQESWRIARCRVFTAKPVNAIWEGAACAVPRHRPRDPALAADARGLLRKSRR